MELRRPLIFRRQGQPPSKAKSPVDQSDKGGLVMSAIRSPPEQKPPNKRPQHVQFADPDKNARPFAPTAGSGGTGGVPTSSMSTAGAGSTSVSSVADGMERVRISDEGQNQVRTRCLVSSDFVFLMCVSELPSFLALLAGISVGQCSPSYMKSLAWNLSLPSFPPPSTHPPIHPPTLLPTLCSSMTLIICSCSHSM